MFKKKAKDNILKKAAKLINILLVAGIILFNNSLSFAEFVSDARETFSASITIPDVIDSDFDGMNNAWESLYGLDPNDPDDASADNDSDGLTNLEEYRNNSNPILIGENGIAAQITANPAGGLQPLDVILTASVVNTSGYDIVKYEWDFDGNGTYDYSSDEESVAYKFTAPGEHNVALRVTSEIGNASIARETITATRSVSSPTVTTALSAIDGEVPVAVVYAATASDSKGIYKYEWDLTGDGEFDIKSTNSAGITYTYKETRTRSFYPSIKVTNADGLSDIANVALSLNAGRWYNTADNIYRPKVVFNSGAIIKNIRAGDPVLLSGYGIPVGGNNFGYAKKLEWDFESDGIYDWVTEINGANWNSGAADVTVVYGAPGIYRATLKVTTEANLSAIDHILIIVAESDENAPDAKARVNYNGNNNEESIQGALPLTAEFIHRTSSGNIRKFEWDFDGDKRFDYSTTARNPQDNKPIYTYTIPGYYLACLRVTDADGLVDTDYIPVFVAMPDTYFSIITAPLENQSIAGNAVGLHCNVFPDDSAVNTVMFQYSADAGATWNNIALGQKTASYAVSWNTTSVLDGTYLIRAIVNATDSLNFAPLSVQVKNNDIGNADVYENSSGTTHTKKIKIDKNTSNEIFLPDGASVNMPQGAISDIGAADDVYLEIINNSVETGGTIEINIIGANANLLQDITISVPYSDADQNGIVDSTSINENTLVLRLFNEETGQWEPIYDSVVYPEENIVSAKINHLSLFGWGGGAIASIIGGGGSSVDAGGVVSFCFIATAAYDSVNAKEVVILREFRDKFLLTTPLGEKFVNCYYKYSPYIARYIKNKPILKKITRCALKPLVKFAEWNINRGR